MPRVASVAVALIAAVVLALVLTRPDGGGTGAGGEVFLQPAAATGPDPFTESSAREAAPSPPPPTPRESAPPPANVTRSVQGSAPGVYSGTRNAPSCDVEKQITSLAAAPARNSAFASVLDIQPSGVPSYLRSLTPVQLRMDTRVTTHGYKDGSPVGYQAVLQAGTAVLVDGRGVPRARCVCGNPLLPPVAVQGTPRRTGTPWPAFQPSDVVVVAPSVQVVEEFIVFDQQKKDWFAREHGDDGREDKKVPPPARPWPDRLVPDAATPPGPSSRPPGSPSEPPRPLSPEPPPGETGELTPASQHESLVDPPASEPEPPVDSPALVPEPPPGETASEPEPPVDSPASEPEPPADSPASEPEPPADSPASESPPVVDEPVDPAP